MVSAAYEPEAGYADPNLTVNAYANAARRLGAKIYLDTEVTDLRFAGGKVTGVTTPKQQFDAPLVLNCAGPWGAHVARMADLNAPINACRVQVAFFRRPAGYEAAHPIIADFIHATYFRSETGQLTLVGLIDPGEADAVVNPDNYNENLDTEFLLDAGERLIRRCPPLEASQSTGGYAALYAITPRLASHH
ncbi:MAG: FAD-binding oxidoreductase [Anaerolineales bacterium]|nr:FAD-binding oxidoreductase [Anaerolineales bacterium]